MNSFPTWPGPVELHNQPTLYTYLPADATYKLSEATRSYEAPSSMESAKYVEYMRFW